MTVLSSPYDFACSLYRLERARLLHNSEQEIDTAMRIIQAPLAFFTGIFTLFQALSTYHVIKNPSFPKKILSPGVAIFGIAVCTIDLVHELVGIKRVCQMRNRLNYTKWSAKDVSLEESKRLIVKDLKYIQTKWLTITPEDEARVEKIVEDALPKKTPKDEKVESQSHLVAELRIGKELTLANRIAPWLVAHLKEKGEGFISRIENGDEAALAEAKGLLTDVNKQIKKKTIVHIIGIIGLILIISGLITMVIACPALIPFILINVGVFIGVVRYLMSEGFFNTQGWHFSASNCIPDCVKSLYGRVTCCRKKAKRNDTTYSVGGA